jgi:seryl-tRNA synthetase
METYQDAGGSIAVPDVLQTYMGGMKKIERQSLTPSHKGEGN